MRAVHPTRSYACRAAALISGTHNVANLQIIMTKIGGVCLITIGVWVVIEVVVQFAKYKHGCISGEGEISAGLAH